MKIIKAKRSIKADTFNTDRHKQLYNKRRNKANDIIHLVNQQDDYNDKLQVLFDELVPSTGQSNNLAGELTRAMMRISYRWLNDGDKFYERYGIETCGSPAQMLYDEVPGVATLMKDNLEGSFPLEDFQYEKLLQDITDTTVDYIVSDPQLFKKKSPDMFSYEPTDIQALEPEYTYEIDLSADVEPLIAAGTIDSSDVEDFVYNLADEYGGEVEHNPGGRFTIVDLTKSEYDTWDDQFIDQVDSWIDRLYEENYSDDE